MPVRFGEFVFDTESRQPLNGGSDLHLSPKAFRLLEVLIARRPAVVSKQPLLDEIWEGQIVEEESVKNLVAEGFALAENDVITIGSVNLTLHGDVAPTATLPAP
ncbi:MAG TPA: winged helix-turn-helix domain-containing protein [Thermoanaerobaculia bacterium]|nr:winged helix-turn-helix domain-containing protein [Thermoanaerobaculia bacterium]